MKNIGYNTRGPRNGTTGLLSYPAFLPRNANRSRYQPKIASQGKVVWDGMMGQRVGSFPTSRATE